MQVRILALVALVFAVLTTANAINKGGDAAVFFEGGRRFLNAEPLYAGSSAADGFIGPPFQAMFFAPFAAVASASPIAAKLLWHALNLASLGIGVWLTATWWTATRERSGLAARSWLGMVVAPLGAVLLPLLTNFEHQNLNALLFALISAATWQLTMGSAIAAGVLVGTATALKAFPALFILYLLARRYWTAAIAAIGTAGLLTTAVPLAVYGSEGFADLSRTFVRLSTSGWPTRGNNQSLIAAIDRTIAGADAGVRVVSETPVAALMFLVLAIAIVLAFTAVTVATRRTHASVAVEVTAVTVIAMLLSPIAWDHYWTMLIPAYLIVYDSRDSRLLGRTGAYLFWCAAIFTTGLSPLTLGTTGFNVARRFSTYTIAALVLYGGLLALHRRLTTQIADE
jgi:alpha-1,2-mannosyltransferase